jgi:hypothetical protein
LVLERQGAALFEEVAQLEIALLGEAEFSGGGDGSQALALAFVEHGQFGENGILNGAGELAGWANEQQSIVSDFEHRTPR